MRFFRNKLAIPSELIVIKHQPLEDIDMKNWGMLSEFQGNRVYRLTQIVEGKEWIVDLELRGNEKQQLQYRRIVEFNFMGRRFRYRIFVAAYSLGSKTIILNDGVFD